MKHLRKRALSLLLAAVMTASLLPVTARAAAPAGGSVQHQYAQSILEQLNESLGDTEVQYALSGPFQLQSSDVYCYELFRTVQDPNTGTRELDTRYVIVPGSDASGTPLSDARMPDYDETTMDDRQWDNSNPSGVYIAQGVTHIGDNAFNGLTTLERVEFQEGARLTSVGSYAFSGCDKLAGPLDLSSVTQLGEYAFSGCGQLGEVTLSDNLETIPAYAFNSCGLTTVNIPANVETIGEGAFANNSLSAIDALVLPEGLTTIGPSAFYLQGGEGTSSSGIRSLTIPSTVTEIGANAFSGRRSLAEVTVTDDKVNGTKLTLGDGAFGSSQFNAYTTQGSITDANGITYEGLLGTTFYLPADVADQFQSGVNCYTGDIAPMRYDGTIPATCTEEGYHIYVTTVSGAMTPEGEPVNITYYYPIPALGHRWDTEQPVTVPATCENDSYTYVVCLNEGCTGRNTVNPSVAPALDHQYTVTSVTPAAINGENATPTTVTYTCENYRDGADNLHDGNLPATYTWTIPATTLYATTSDTLAGLASQLPTPVGSHSAVLRWAESDTDAELEAGGYDYQVEFAVTAGSNFESYTAANFTIHVEVSRTKLDFSDVTFENADRWIGGNTPEFEVTGLPDVTITKREYRLQSGAEDSWTTVVPPENDADDEGQYLVRVTFTYNDEKYQLVDEEGLLPPAEYTLEAGAKEGTGTITGDYTVRQMTMEDIVVETPGRTFNGTSDDPDGSKQSTVRLSGVPDGSKVTMTWTENGDTKTEVVDETTSSLVNGAYITDAGIYTVSIKVENGQYKPFERTVQVTILPQTVPAPEPNSVHQYSPGVSQTGVTDRGDGRYTLTGNTGTNAGSYTAEAELVSDNYVWSKYDEDKDGTAEIPWQIPYRLLQRPTILEALRNTEYNGQEKEPLSILSGDITRSYDDDGKLSARFNDVEVAYTATDAKGTDARDYTVTVHLENKNYKWTDQTTDDFTLEWKIRPRQINMPTVQVNNSTYDGKAYNLEGQEIILTAHSGNSEGILALGTHTYYQGQTELSGAPADAGGYSVDIGFAYENGKKPSNYQIIGDTRRNFSINQAKLTLTEPTEPESDLSVTYTGSDYTVPAPEVRGWQNGETAETAKGFALIYTYVFTPAGREPGEPEAEKTATGKLNVREAGSYAISVTVDDSCRNYTEAETVEYTFNIGAADQEVVLTSGDGDWNGVQKTITKTLGEAGFTVTGTGSLDPASEMKYEVTEAKPEGVITVTATGAVTMRKTGTATVTVSTDGTANAGPAEASYTVTVEQATPTVTVNLPAGGQDGSYGFTGQPLTFTATVTGVGNGAEAPTGTENITYTFYASDEEGKQGQLLGEDQPTAVGAYWVTAAYGGDANYTSRTSAAQSFTISPARLTVEVLNPYDGEDYDGSAHAAAAGFTVTGNGQDLTDAATITYAESADGDYTDSTMPQVKDAGEYTVYYKVSVPNYDDSTGKFTVKVNPYNVTLKGDVTKTKPYDGNNTAEVSIDGTVEGAGGETINVSAQAVYADGENVGTGKDITVTYTLSGDANLANYTFNGEKADDAGQVTETVPGGVIEAKKITVVGVDAQDRAYDGTNVVTLTQTKDFGFAEDAIVPGDTVGLTFKGGTGTVSDENASDTAKTVTVTPGKVVTLGGDDAKNYTVTKVVTDTASGKIDVEISRRKVTLSVKDVDQEGKIEEGYTGSAITLTAEITDAVFAENATLDQGDVKFTYEQDGKPVLSPITQGTYGVTVSLKEAAESTYSNFDIKSGGCTLEITNATLTVTSATYTGTYNGSSHNVLKGWSYTSTTGKPVDASAVTVTFQLVGADNADEPDADGTWLRSDSFVNAAQSGRYWYRVEYESHSTVYGKEPVIITIDPAPLTLDSELTPQKVYDSTNIATVTNGTVTGQQDNESITLTQFTAIYDDENVDPDKTITITYTLTFGEGADPDNYTVNSGTVEKDGKEWTVKVTRNDGEITKAPVTITIGNQNDVYDGKPAELDQTEWSFDGDKFYESDDVDIALSAGNAVDAGTYDISGSKSGDDADNYIITWNEGELTIAPRPIQVTIGNAEGYYGDSHTVTAGQTEGQVTLAAVATSEPDEGLVDGETVYKALPGLTLTTDAKADSPVNGEYEITAEAKQYGNYQAEFTPGAYTVKHRPITIHVENHSSSYGQSIDSVLADPEPGDDYTASITGRVTTGDAIVGDDDLGVTLSLTDPNAKDAGTYQIQGAAEGADASNYAITWTGNGDPIPDREGQKYGKYTVEQAGLEINFTYGNQVTNGVSINITDTYDSNALELKNETTGASVSDADKGTLDIVYAIGPAGGGNDDVSAIATVDPATGAVTIRSTGTVRITATVTPQDGSNYTGTKTTWYELNIIGGGSMSMWVTPAQGLTYNGRPQDLLTDAGCTLDGAELSYRLEGENDWSDTIPQAEDAGSYTVHYKAEDPDGQYADYENHVTVEIAKADLKGAFDHKEFRFPLTQGSSYDSAKENPLTISEAENPNYTANPGTYTYQSSDSAVASADNAGSTILVRGQAGESAVITVTVPGDDNYNETTFSYTLVISDQLSVIEHTVTGEEEPTYDGQAHTLTVEVTEPASAQVLYMDANGDYTLTAPPAYTDVKRNADTGAVEGYEIKFQITAPGYTTVEGSETLTIQPKNITKGMFEDSIGNYTYTNGRITPEPVVTDGTLLLEKNEDYTVTWGKPNQNVGVYNETDQTGGTVTVTGMGNYGGAATDTFEITAVGQNSLTAAMTRSWGVYGDVDTNNTKVTVSHGDRNNGGHPVDGSEITITVTDVDENEVGSDKATVDKATQTVTFHDVGMYTLEVTVSGNHSGSFTLHYTLLPAGGDEGLTLTVDGKPTPAVYTYGDKVDGDITVKAGDTPLGTDDYTLTYSYQPFAAGGNIQPVEAGTDYDPAQVFGEKIPAAGLYVVTAKAVPDGSYTGSGTFVFLVQQKNLEDEMIGAIGDQTYTGAAIEPHVTVSFTGDGADNLIAADDYDVSRQDNVNAGPAKIIVTAKAESNNFTGAASASFTIDPKDLSQFTVAPIGEQRHTGEKITPALTVTDPDRGKALIQGLDFTADYKNNINVGEAQVTITGTGNYMGTITGTTFRIVATVSSFDLALDKVQWTWGESGPAKVEVSYTSGGAETPLVMGADYVLTVDGVEYADMDAALEALTDLEPGSHTVTARGKTGTGYAGLSDTVTVTISKIQPVLSVAASPHTLSSAGEVTLTLKGENLPADVDNLPELLTVAATSGTAPDLEKLTWTEDPAGTWTAKVSLPNASNTYTFTLAFTPDGEDAKYYESARASDTVVTAQHTSSGGGGGGGGGQATAFTITASAGTGGDITPAGAVAVVRGGSQSFAIAPAEGYEIADVLVDGDSVGAVSSYTFSNVTKNHTITVSFDRTEEIADPDETGVSGWLNTTDHMAYMQGYPGNLFGPDDNMTRAEAAQMFYNLLLDKDVAITVSFTDVEESAWYSRAVHVLASLGVLEGVGGGLFAPERSITRAEFTAIAMRFADLKTDGDNPFSDVYEDEWFYDVVVGSVRYGWINGYPDGTFRPYDTIARAEAAATTNRMLGRSADRDYVDAHREALTRFADLSTGYWAYYEIMEAANGHTYRRDDAFEDWTGLT